MRKRSTETELRHAKREIKQLRFTITALRNAGRPMANICYNVAHRQEKLQDYEKKLMEECYQAWDLSLELRGL